MESERDRERERRKRLLSLKNKLMLQKILKTSGCKI
jgi:hypothetical protein